MLRRILIIFTFLIAGSCATYYQANYNFNQEFESGNLDRALESLQANSSEAKGKREFLYFVNNGLVLSMVGRYEESNEFFEKAFLFGEDYRINYLNEAASYLTNPNFTSYKGEDHEHLMLLYYKAINYLKMGKTDEALVECRRLNIRLQQLTDRYQSEDKYQRDAFVHTLMGIIYEVDKDYNNAFIAYRNAVEIYETDYRRLFHLSTPQQVKEDLLRTAFLCGMTSEFEAYKIDFGMEDYVYQPQAGGEVVYFWHDGLSPVKAQWGVNFAVNLNGNFVYFSNPELGVTFPFNIEGYSEQDRRGLASLQFFRVVFPKYIERPTYYTTASLELNGETHDLQLLEDVNKIAFKCLQERMGLEFSKALIRVALKKSLEYSVKREDKTMGAVLGLINAATERADTRNWQTLPHSIYYARVPLPIGTSTITLRVKGNGKPEASYPYTYDDVKKGEIRFHTFSSLESDYPNYGF